MDIEPLFFLKTGIHMLLERCGKACFTQIRPTLFFSLLLLPIFLAIIYLSFQKIQLQQLENRFAATAEKGKSTIEKKRRKEQFLNRFSEADPYFINKKIESLAFLETEKENLKILIQHPALPNKKLLKERFAFLSGEENRLAFSEENIRSSTKIKETDEKQRHPVQVDEKDLKKLFSLIEDVSINPFPSPQLIIRNFKLKKRETLLQNEVFEVEMELLKREWIR